ncbi:MAG TPA: hypothetical protein VGE07_07935, partial [Herpetosiphonaceae bacterium]
MERLVWRRWLCVMRGGVIGGLALAAMLAAPMPSAAGGPQPTYGDYGDAPDTVRDGRTMLAHPYTDPSVIARYPTVGLDDPRQPSGPWHREPWARMWLGQGVDIEANADAPSSSPLPNIAAQSPDVVASSNKDLLDDGLSSAGIYLPACGLSSFSYTVSGAPTMGDQAATINVWLDFNRDGDWRDVLKCVTTDGLLRTVPEWAVANQPITVG